MLYKNTLTLLTTLGLTGMATAYREQQQIPDIATLGFDDRLSLLLEREANDRADRRLERLLRLARFRFPSAKIDDVIFTQRPGLDRSQLLHLALGEWVKFGQTTLVTGACGVGKSWLACALGHAACKRGFTVRFARVSALSEELTRRRLDGTYARYIARLHRTDLVILDDFGTGGFDAQGRRDLLDLLEERYDRKATLVTSQFPVPTWHSLIGDTNVADAVLDRLVHHAHRIELQGESLRKRLTPEQRRPPATDADPAGTATPLAP
jgi:DNA replication protein DnaC